MSRRHNGRSAGKIYSSKLAVHSQSTQSMIEILGKLRNDITIIMDGEK